MQILKRDFSNIFFYSRSFCYVTYGKHIADLTQLISYTQYEEL